MQKRNLLYVGNKLSEKGRTVSTIDSLSLLLEREGFTVYTTSSKKNKIIRFLDMVGATFKYASKVSYVLIDTYSTQNFYYAVVIGWICRILKVPYIPILHGGNLPNRLLKSPRLSRNLFNGAKVCVAPSKYLTEEFRDYGYDNLEYIPNSVEIVNYPFLLRKEIQPNILWVRSFDEIYNPMLAIDLLKNLTQNGIEATLTMIGPEKDGSLEKCRALAKEYELEVNFTGKLKKTEWIELSKSYDVFINTTNFDNMPVSLIEASALGLPIISTDVAGIPYLLQHNETGLLVPPNNSNAFMKAMNDLIDNPSKVARISLNARKNVVQFDWDEVKNKWLALMS